MSDWQTWQDANLAALQARLAPIRALEDGTLCTEIAGIHFLVVTKEGADLRFWLMEQSNPSTGVIQSEIDLANPLALLEAYTQGLLMSLMWQPTPQSIYVAGFGGGRLPTVMHHHLPEASIVCTEIDPSVVQIAERYFGVRQDERLHVIIQDGRTWLEQHEQSFDIILLDVFLDNGYTPYRMTTVEFFRLCRERLNPGGVLAVNLLPSDPYLDVKTATLAAEFPSVLEFTLAHENTILFAGDNLPADPTFLRDQAATLAAWFGPAYRFKQNAARVIPAVVTPVGLFHDATPPADYFDNLPSFDAPFSRTPDHLPCPCGSGRTFAECHGKSTA